MKRFDDIPSSIADLLSFKLNEKGFYDRERVEKLDVLKIGVLFSGGPAPGGHNVLVGLYDALDVICKEFTLVGFLRGSEGLLENQSIVINKDLTKTIFNKGGFYALQTSRKKIETPEEFEKAAKNCEYLDGLIIIGGDDSNTNAALLSQYINRKGSQNTQIIGVPKTIDNDLQTHRLKQDFGFSTVVDLYSRLVEGLYCDALSTGKYWHFVRLMGRSASHITLAVAIKAKPTLTFISEEVKFKKWGFAEVIKMIVTKINHEREKGNNFGVILFPEGLIEQFDELKKLLEELSVGKLSSESNAFYEALPVTFRDKLTVDLDEHGNISISKISLEELIIEATKDQLGGDLTAIPHFYGYEARCIEPNMFDKHYCYYLGQVAALCVRDGLGGSMAILEDIDRSVTDWKPGSEDLSKLMVKEMRNGKEKMVIDKTLVDLKSQQFEEWKKNS